MHWVSKLFSVHKETGSPIDRVNVSVMVRLMGGLILIILALILCFLVTLVVFYLVGLFFSRYFT